MVKHYNRGIAEPLQGYKSKLNSGMQKEQNKTDESRGEAGHSRCVGYIDLLRILQSVAERPAGRKLIMYGVHDR